MGFELGAATEKPSPPVQLPDTRLVPQSVYQRLGVDEFFSLWLVFLVRDLII